MIDMDQGVPDFARPSSTPRASGRAARGSVPRSFPHLQIARPHLEPQFLPALAHAQKRDPGQPALAKEAEHGARLAAACVTALHAGQLQANYGVQIQAHCVTALALDREGDARFGYSSGIAICKPMESWRARRSCCGRLQDCGQGCRGRREAGCRGARCRGNISRASRISL